jgi:hypothetical protein
MKKKISTTAVKQNRNFSGQKLTIVFAGTLQNPHRCFSSQDFVRALGGSF